MSVKLYVDIFLYQNIPLKDVTNIDILNRVYSEPRKKRKMLLQYHKKRYKEKNVY